MSASPTAIRASAAASATACLPPRPGPASRTHFPASPRPIAENVPMLVMPAALPLARQYLRPVFRAADVYRPVTKWSALAHSVQELPDLMRRAYHAMRSGKGGPVLVEVPPEVWEAEYQGRARLRARADASARARSGRGQAGGADAAGGQEPDAVGRPGRASMREAERAARGAGRARSRRRSSPPIRARARFPTAIRWRSAPPPARARRCSPTTWRRPTWCSRSARA